MSATFTILQSIPADYNPQGLRAGELVSFAEETRYRTWLFPGPEPMGAGTLGPVGGGEVLVVLEVRRPCDYVRVLTLKGVTGWIHESYLRRAP